jgi:hypothetical protein
MPSNSAQNASDTARDLSDLRRDLELLKSRNPDDEQYPMLLRMLDAGILRCERTVVDGKRLRSWSANGDDLSLMNAVGRMRNEIYARCLELFLLGQFEFTTELRKPLDVTFRMKPAIAASYDPKTTARDVEAILRARRKDAAAPQHPM